MIKQYRQVALIGFCFFLVGHVFAADAINTMNTVKFYRYINDKGELILSNQIPPNDVSRGYEVLDKHGKVLSTVDPALTPEQREAKTAEEAQAKNDKKIMSLYSSYDDIDRAQRLSLEQLDGSLLIIKENISSLIRQREKLQDSAANMERSGNAVPADVTQKLFNIDKSIKSENKRLQDQQANKKRLTDTYTADRARLGELRNLPKPTTVPDTELKPLKLSGGTSTTTGKSSPVASGTTSTVAPANNP